MRCPACGFENPSGMKFCGECGASLKIKCSNCGFENAPGIKFCGECGAPLADAAPSPVAVPEERRWATVLFADLAGFTAISEQMDPEDVKGLAQRCAAEMSEEVRRHGGTVIDIMGDGVLAVFGAPVAHEDDAERAVRTGLAIRDRHFKDAHGNDIPVHVGINTGEVMAGQIGPAEHRQYAVLGDTTNTASRLTGAAPPGCVLVGAETYRATHRKVRYGELAAVSVKGKQEPLAAWEALEVGAVPEARLLRTMPLVGRASELALLSQVWAKVVRESRPHLVTVVGEAGIGKSRFVAEAERRVLSGVSILRGRCLPYGEALGYWALATALRSATGIAAEDDAATARAKLGSVVAQMIGPGRFVDAGPGNIARHLALLAGLDTPTDRQETADQRTLHASATRFVEALARRGPLCLMFEDIHWADAALLDLIEFVAARTPAVPLMIVAQARPELLEKRPAWGRGVRGFVTIPLEPLDKQEAAELLKALCQERGVTKVLARELAAAAGGNPLFCEELVATINERGVVDLVPSSIKLLIQARLDALPASERRTLQRAAVFGKAFWEGGLRTLGVADPVGEQLEYLEGKDLLRSQPRSQLRGEREYLFKHDLVRDVAYEMLPRSDRRILHRRAAAWLELAGGDRLDELLSVLAHHAVQA
jgi:class 3 adenylate cyclase